MGRRASQHFKGFTIVELLVVIVVIAILATISIVVYNGLQDRARSTEIITSFKNIEKGFRLLGVEQGRTTWWPDTEFTGANNPNINQIISSSNLSSYLQTLKPISSSPSSYFIYDNDGDTMNTSTCTSGQMYQAVNIILRYMSSSLWELVDKAMDDGLPDCGKVRWSSANSEIVYKLGYTQELQ